MILGEQLALQTSKQQHFNHEGSQGERNNGQLNQKKLLRFRKEKHKALHLSVASPCTKPGWESSGGIATVQRRTRWLQFM